MLSASQFVFDTENGLAPANSGIEDLREKGELQKAYYSFLHAITSSNGSHVLLQTPSATLHQALGALVEGGAGHIDPGIRKTCLQVWDSASRVRVAGRMGRLKFRRPRGPPKGAPGLPMSSPWLYLPMVYSVPAGFLWANAWQDGKPVYCA